MKQNFKTMITEISVVAGFAGILALGLTGCGSTYQPNVGSGEVEDKTLSGNTVDFLTLIRVQNNYGTNISISDSDNGKATK